MTGSPGKKEKAKSGFSLKSLFRNPKPDLPVFAGEQPGDQEPDAANESDSKSDASKDSHISKHRETFTSGIKKLFGHTQDTPITQPPSQGENPLRAALQVCLDRLCAHLPELPKTKKARRVSTRDTSSVSEEMEKCVLPAHASCITF